MFPVSRFSLNGAAEPPSGMRVDARALMGGLRLMVVYPKDGEPRLEEVEFAGCDEPWLAEVAVPKAPTATRAPEKRAPAPAPWGRSIDRVLEALKACGAQPQPTRKPGQWSARCPGHDDRKPSLSISEATDGKVLLHCHAGCPPESIVRALGLEMHDLMPERTDSRTDRAQAKSTRVQAKSETASDGRVFATPEDAQWALEATLGPVAARWDYSSATGELVGAVLRWNTTRGKEIRPVAKHPDGWRIGVMPEPRPLYKLPEILKAPPDVPIVVVEGEKAAEAAQRLGLVATTSAGGAQAASKTDWSPLRGRRVIVLPDNDSAGERYAEDVARLAHTAGAADIRILRLADYAPALPEGGDLWDVRADDQWCGLPLGDAAKPADFCHWFYAEADRVEPWKPAADSSQKGQCGAVPEQTYDYGHALILASLFKNRYRWAIHRGAWMHYDGKVWRQITEEAMATAASAALQEYYRVQLSRATTKEAMANLTGRLRDTYIYARIKGALAFLRGWPGIETEPKEWDRDAWVLNLDNGTLDLKTRKLRPHRPEDLITKLAPVRYDPTAQGERWRAHIKQALPNPNIRRQVQRDLGVALVGVTLEEVLPVWYGTGANGKTTTCRALLEVLGDYAGKTAPQLLIQTSHERHPTEIADLAGLRLAFSVEVDEGKRLAEALVKDLTCGDRKKARYMRQDFFEFEQTFSLILVVNHKPIVVGTDEGIWRRIRLIPWEYTIPPAERRAQEEIVAELVADGPGILNWALEGLADWQADYHWEAEEVKAATQKYRAEMDRLDEFITTRCVLGPTRSIPKGELYKAYQAWCESMGERLLPRPAFTRRLEEKGIQEARDKKHRYYVGIDLAKPTGGGQSEDGHDPWGF